MRECWWRCTSENRFCAACFRDLKLIYDSVTQAGATFAHACGWLGICWIIHRLTSWQHFHSPAILCVKFPRRCWPYCNAWYLSALRCSNSLGRILDKNHIVAVFRGAYISIKTLWSLRCRCIYLSADFTMSSMSKLLQQQYNNQISSSAKCLIILV